MPQRKEFQSPYNEEVAIFDVVANEEVNRLFQSPYNEEVAINFIDSNH